MAIITEKIVINNKEFIRTYSDSNCYVVRDGISYDEAIDPAQLGRTYTEGDTKPYEPESDAETVLNIILGEGDSV